MTVETRAEQILEWVRAAGATGDVIVDQGESLSLKARDGALEEHKVSSSQVFGLRVIKDDNVGTAYSEAADPEALKSMVDQALQNAAFARAEVSEKIPDSQLTLSTDDAVFCPEDSTSIEAKIDAALAIERLLSSRDRVQNVPYNGLQDNAGQRQVFTTAGLSARSRSRMFACFAHALMVDGEHNVMEGSGQAGRQFADLDINHLVDEAWDNCNGLLLGKPVASGRYDVIFDKECQIDVIRTFGMMFSGKAAKDGVNPMRDKVGEVVADPRLNLSDSPLLADGFGYALFDAEGSPTVKTPLIQHGELVTLIHNSATAGHFGCKTTGHADRGPRSTMGVGLHQLEVEAGPDADVLAGEYLELTDLTGLHSGANPIAGDFSFGASGYLCRDGERIKPVRGVTVAGNFYNMIRQIRAIGDTQLWDWQRSALMPHIRFADVAISG